MQPIMMLSVLAALSLAAPVYAQDPVGNAYGGAGDVAGVITAGGEGSEVRGVRSATSATTPVAPAAAKPAAQVATAQPLRGSELPFTGLDMALLALGGATLLALGCALRHVATGPRSSTRQT